MRHHGVLRRGPSALWRRLSTAAASSAIGVDSDSVLAALQAFRASHGHVLVPPRFVVPATGEEDNSKSAWPADTHGLKLGVALQRMYDMARRPENRSIREQLQALGVEVREDTGAYDSFYWQATVLAALRTYKALHGDVYVPRSYVVPTGESPWPLAARGLPLGQQVHSLRVKAATHTIPKDQRDALDEIGFAWDVMEHKWSTKFLPALRRFHEIHGNCNVPQKFTVPPSADWRDLPQCHGYRLGSAVNKVRRGDSFTAQVVRHVDELQALGFTFTSLDHTWNAKVLPALETFYDLHGHSHVATTFSVPSDDDRWPRAAWGMALGFVVQNIRSRGDFFPQIMRDGERLDAIGFVWNRTDVKWRQCVLPALETFVAVHRHAHVPAGFVVPHKSPWPERAYGLRLGRIATMPSARTRFADYIEMDRKRLERMGLDWSVLDDTQSE